MAMYGQNYQKEPGENDPVEAYYEEVEGSLPLVKRLILRAILDSPETHQLVNEMMAWAYEQSMNAG